MKGKVIDGLKKHDIKALRDMMVKLPIFSMLFQLSSLDDHVYGHVHRTVIKNMKMEWPQIP